MEITHVFGKTCQLSITQQGHFYVDDLVCDLLDIHEILVFIQLVANRVYAAGIKLGDFFFLIEHIVSRLVQVIACLHLSGDCASLAH